MAHYRLSVAVHTRSKGHSATAAAAYRAGARIHDERTGEWHDYRRKSGVLYTEIVVPPDAPDWARDREALWNAAEAAENRKNSCIARDVVVSLPVELTLEQRRALTLTLATEISQRHHCAVDVALHKPDPHGDGRNFHAHLLCSTRRLKPEGFTQKTRELDDQRSGEVLYWRDRWEKLQNERLKVYGHSARVDCRSLKDQGLEREPTRHQGPAISAILARGERSHVAERWQAEANDRLAHARQVGALERESTVLQSRVLDVTTELVAALQERDLAKAPHRTPEVQRERARAAWLAHRQSPEQTRDSDKTVAPSREHTADLDSSARQAKQETLILTSHDERSAVQSPDRSLILPDSDHAL